MNSHNPKFKIIKQVMDLQELSLQFLLSVSFKIFICYKYEDFTTRVKNS